MSISSMCLVEIDGQQLPADVVPLLISAYIDDSQRLPDMFGLRFRDPGRIVLSKSNAKVGAKVKISVQVTGEQTPAVLLQGEITALEAEFDSGGTFTVIRGYDQAHRLFRGRHTESFVQMTASDIAKKVAQKAGLKVGKVTSTSTVFPHVSQAGQTDWELMEKLTRDNGYEVAVRDGSFSFTTPTTASEAPAAGGPNSENPLVLEVGKDLLRFRSVISSAQQSSKVEVRGWDIATKKALTSTAPAKTTSADLPTVKPEDLAKVFNDPVHVSADVPYRTQAEVDEAAKSFAEELAGTFAEFEGVARGNTKLRAGAAISVSGLGEPFDGKYTVTTSRHRFEPTTGYTTAFTVSGKHDRSLLGLASGGRAGRSPIGVAVGQISDAQDPEKAGRVKLTFPWLSDDYVSDWARTVQLGAGKNRGWAVLPEVGDEVLVAFEQGDFSRPTVLGGLYNGVDTMPAGPVDLVDGGSGAINRRSMVSRNGHRIDLLDQNGQKEGITLATKDNKLLLKLDSVGTTITLHADGKVVVEGTQGITIDASSSNIDVKGGKITLKATNGVDVDGGGGAVSVKTNGQLSLNGTTAKLEGSASTEVKGGAMCSVSAAMVKIN
jgi:phage protein D/phage baseplate assembly protein gpV